MNIYLIIESTGQYEDRYSCPIMAFRKECSAARELDRLTELAEKTEYEDEYMDYPYYSISEVEFIE